MIKDFFKYLVNTLLDRRCKVCGAALEHNEFGVCSKCEVGDLFFQPQLHMRGNIVEERLYGLAKFKTAESLMIYSDVAQSLIHDLKYYNSRNIAQLFGRKIGEYITNNGYYPQFDYIVPVPLHANRIKQRGYNQSELIANKIAEKLGTIVESTNLYRTYDNPSQTHKNYTERQQNVKNIFALHNPTLFENKTILLIDDVFTTGSTIIDCCRALNQSTNINIHIFTVAAAHIY